MERWTTIKLISQTVELTPIGEQRTVESVREIYALVSSVTSNEWFSAQRNDINSRYRLKVHEFEYKSERLCEVDGIRYKIYRVFEDGIDFVELYLEEKVGE